MKLIKLVYNELYKIFHKKLIYILIPVNNTKELNFLDRMNLNDPNEAQQYVVIKPTIDVSNIQKEKKFDVNGPEYYYLNNDILNTYGEYYTAKYIEKDEEKANGLKTKVDEMVASLDNFDWKKQIQDEINELKNIPEEFNSDETKERIRVLEYRLNNNIPYANSEASQELNLYIENYVVYQSMEKDDSKIIKHEDLYQKKMAESSVAIGQYKLDHNLYKNDYKSTNAQSAFVGTFATLGTFVIVCILMVAGQIVAEEYSKGTIKQLLVRPYTRSKIIISKIIATMIVVFIFMLFLAVIDSVITGIFTNSFGSLFDPIIQYNYNTKSVMVMNTITKSLMNLLAILPEIIILTLFTVLISALIGNTALSVVLGFVLMFIPGMFSGLVSKVKALSYVFVFNWDLTDFMYGGVPFSQYLTLPKALIVDLITIAALVAGILIVFKKKQIKNQ